MTGRPHRQPADRGPQDSVVRAGGPRARLVAALERSTAGTGLLVHERDDDVVTVVPDLTDARWTGGPARGAIVFAYDCVVGDDDTVAVLTRYTTHVRRGQLAQAEQTQGLADGRYSWTSGMPGRSARWTWREGGFRKAYDSEDALDAGFEIVRGAIRSADLVEVEATPAKSARALMVVVGVAAGVMLLAFVMSLMAAMLH